jgi:hypothetical protein
MANRCGVCNLPHSVADSIACIGPCERIFHYNCTGLSKSVVKNLVECKNLSFKCDACMLMCYKPLEEKIDKLEVELSSLKTFLYGLLNNSALPTAPKTQPLRAAKKVSTPIGSPLVFQNLLAASSSTLTAATASNATTDHNSGQILGTGPKPTNINLAEPKFWMYLSGLDPSTDESELQRFLQDSFESEAVKCVTLLPPGRSQDTCEFVSFKIGFPLGMKNDVINPTAWPEGFIVREFKEKTSKPNFRSRQRSQSTNRSNVHRYRQQGRQTHR